MDNRRQLMLALDTSGITGSIALREEGKLLYASSFGVRVTHSETLLPEVENALRFCEREVSDISAVCLCNGPGSFTGLRIGLATAKGIAYGLKIPLYAYNALEVAAMYRWNCGRNILCILDAKMQEVYAALYDELLRVIVPPTVCNPTSIGEWQCGEAFLLGNAAHLVNIGNCTIVPESAREASNTAASLFALHDLKQDAAPYDFQAIAELEPFYLRESTAQIRLRTPKNISP